MWSINGLLTGNLEGSTKIIHLGGDHPTFTYTVDDILIEKMKPILNLDFPIIKDLIFDLHGERIATIATRIVSNLLRGLRTRNTISYLSAYKSYLGPTLEHGTVIFNPLKKKIASKLEIVQNVKLAGKFWRFCATAVRSSISESVFNLLRIFI